MIKSGKKYMNTVAHRSRTYTGVIIKTCSRFHIHCTSICVDICQCCVHGALTVSAPSLCGPHQWVIVSVMWVCPGPQVVWANSRLHHPITPQCQFLHF